MNETIQRSRRLLLRGAVAGAGVGLLSGCDALSEKKLFVDTLSVAEPVNQTVQRLFTRGRLAREFPESMISPLFRPNGSIDPQTPEYLALKSNNFASYRLQIRGLIESPADYSLDALRAMPARTQITRHDCVEGWSVIGGWTGVPLARLLDAAKLKPGARYVMFHCFDDLTGDGTVITRASIWTTPTTRKPLWRTASMVRLCRWATVRRCACAWSASSGTNMPSICAVSKSSRVTRASGAATAVIGKTTATIGTAESNSEKTQARSGVV
jgi:DMSO/TMAO reductase YedYZ molybdopterin-dependent catalytic subunit